MEDDGAEAWRRRVKCRSRMRRRRQRRRMPRRKRTMKWRRGGG